VKTLSSWLRIIRPPILFISCLGVLVGALNCTVYLHEDISFFQIIMILLGSAFLSSGLMIHNDVTDLKSDEINRPHKPLPSRRIKVRTARVVGIFLMVFSIIIALLINIEESNSLNWRCGFLTFIVMGIGLYYNYYGKYHGILGNIAVALGVGAIPFWGALGVFPSEPFLMLPLALAIFVQEIGREIMVNAGDYVGDLKAGFRTLPIQVGRKRSMYIALLFYLAFIPLYPLPAFDWTGLGIPKLFGLIYLVGGAVFMASLLLTWVLTYLVVVQNDEKKIWHAFERYERTGTRVMVIVFQVALFLEIFF
jgi:geranylgeranylglycerol-phosphate geranylgeranyltransferase